MGYESAPATKLLATHCACCNRPLVDATSVEVGMGPVCRDKNGYDAVLALPEDDRKAANKLIYEVALKRDGATVLDACTKLFALGCGKIVTAVLKRLAKVQIAMTDDTHPHGAGRLAVRIHGEVPDFPSLLADFRAIRGRRWDAKHKINTFPAESKAALFETLKRNFPGATAVGPKGPFVIPGKAAPEPVKVSLATLVVPTVPAKATVVGVEIDRAEGPCELCDGVHKFDSLDAAQKFLLSRADTYPATGGYDKHDVTVVFSDGERIELRMDCKAPGCKNNDLDIMEHLRDFVTFYAGLRCPAHLTRERYEAFLAENGADEKADFLKFVETHEIGL